MPNVKIVVICEHHAPCVMVQSIHSYVIQTKNVIKFQFRNCYFVTENFIDCKGRLCFQKRLSVILSTGVRQTSLPGCRPRGICPTPLEAEPLDTNPLDADPPRLRPPGCRPPVVTSSGGHCSGRYPSYWNAFLSKIILIRMEREFVATAFHGPF